MTETIDTANLRALAEASKAWMKNPAAWIVPGSKGVAFFGSVLDGEKYEIGQVDTENYYQEPAALPLAQFIAAANPTTMLALLDRLAAAEARNATLTDDAAPADPMDWRLPCDVTVGHGTMRKGVKLRTLVTRMKVLYEMATGNNADEVANRTPEQNAALADAFQARAAASISTKEGDGHA